VTTCRACGRACPDGGRYCPYCGTPVQPACASCGQENPSGSTFCLRCGQLLDPSKAAPSHAAGQTRPSIDPGRPASLGGGRYQIGDLLGEGARKRVYKAHDTRLDRTVAVALVRTEGLDAAGLDRVRRETRAMGRLGDHPNVVTVYDVGDDDGRPFIVSQYLSGGDVEQLLQTSPDHRLSLERAARIAADVAAALAHAHAHDTVHRDVKPGNVWLAGDGTARLGDFGLAAVAESSRLTTEGMIVGTVAYLPPEQAIGRLPDPRSDLYSLGATVYELITGLPPFVGDDAVAVISQHLHIAPVAPSWHNPAVPPALESLVLQLLAKNPEDRPPSATAVHDQLVTIGAALASGSDSEATTASEGANPLDRLAAGAFVGRESEMTQLRAAVDDALSGRGRLVLLAGEPGIGKTRCCDELATYARLRGAQVLTGRCYESQGAPAYWPWVQVVRSYAHERDPDDLRSELGSGASVIAQVVPEVAARVVGLASPPLLDPEQARFRLFDSIAAFLKNAAQRQPLLLVLDDLHWADEPSLLLLRYLAAEMTVGRIVVVATYRDVELGRHHPLAGTLAELARHTVTSRLALHGLAREDVDRYLEITAGHTPAAGLTDAVYQETEGNPFFLAEVVRLLAADGRLDTTRPDRWSLTIPQGVREVIGRRLEHLDEATNDVLTIAAVCGRTFALDPLVNASERDEMDVLTALDEAIGARLVAEVAGTATRFTFAHALIRETVYDELTVNRRIRLHRKIALALEPTTKLEDQAAVAELAHHFAMAAPGGDVDRAVSYAELAAQLADAALAYEEAARFYSVAAQTLEMVEPVDEARRAELVMCVGLAYKRAGDVDQAREAFRVAFGIGRVLGEADLMGRAGLGFGRPGMQAGIADEESLAFAGEALEALGPEPSALRARLLGRLAADHYVLDLQLMGVIAGDAVNVAREAGDQGALGYALLMAVIAGEGVPDKLAMATEAIDASLAAGDRDIATLSRLYRAWNLLLIDRMDEAHAEIERFTTAAEELQQPMYLWHGAWFRTSQALFEGRFAEGLQLADEALVLGSRVSSIDARQGHVMQRFVARRTTVDLEPLAETLSALADELPTMPIYVGVLAVIRAEQGRVEETAALLARLASELPSLRTDAFRLATLSMAAEAAVAIDDVDVASAVLDPLRRDLATNVVFGACGAYLGPKTRYIGLAALAVGEIDDAVTQLRDAADRVRAVKGEPWQARNQLDLARALLRRDGPGDRADALRATTEAIEVGRAHAMTMLVEHALATKLEAQGAVHGYTDSSIDVVAAAVSSEEPDLLSLFPEAEAGTTVTILFTDIVDSTRSAERIGDRRWLEVLRAHNAVVRAQLRRHQGVEVKARGDGFMLAFAGARRAVQCAVAIQRVLEAQPIGLEGDDVVRLRIGVHTGEALQAEHDLFGRHVNLAARIADRADGGEVLVSALTRDILFGSDDLVFGVSEEVELRGVAGSQMVVPVVWRDAAPSVSNDVDAPSGSGEDAKHAGTGT
jgi:class 3 adenylate cyclase